MTTTPTATIFLPWQALDEVHQRGTRVAQPAATAVVAGTLYCVSDEGGVLERSNGTTWESYSPSGGEVERPGISLPIVLPEVPPLHAWTHAPGSTDPLPAYLAVADVDQITRRGTRAQQPAASAVVPGTLYCVTDERFSIQRSTGTAWEIWSPRRHVAMFSFDFAAATTEPPGLNQVRLNGAAPYTTVTKLWIRLVTTDGRDVYYGLMGTDVGTLIRVQDQNDHTIMVSFTLVASPIDKTTYVEWPVAFLSATGAALNGGQAVLVIKQ